MASLIFACFIALVVGLSFAAWHDLVAAIRRVDPHKAVVFFCFVPLGLLLVFILATAFGVELP